MKHPPVSVIETPSFLRDAKGNVDDDERQNIINFLAFNPDVGNIIPGTGGVRKLRWARKGEGKSGGFRIIYFFHNWNTPLFALNIFGKNEKANLSQAEHNDLKRLAALLVDSYSGGRQ